MDKEEQKTLIEAFKSGNLPPIQAFLARDTSWLYSPLYGTMLPINIAAKNGHVDILLLLLETDRSMLDLKDIYDQTPLIWASLEGQANVLQLLIFLKADLQCASNALGSYFHGWTALTWATQRGHHPCVDLLQEAYRQAVRKAISENSSLLVKPDDTGETLLFKSTRFGHIEAVKYLIRKGADVHALHGQSQYNLLHIAAKYGHLTLAQYLLEEVNPHYLEQTDSRGQTAIFFAATNGDLNILQYLVEKGAKSFLTSDEGKTPIECAINQNQYDIVFFLILLLSLKQPIETLLAYVQHAQVAIKLMEVDASYVHILLGDTRINELIHASRCCEATEQRLNVYEPATARSLSRYGEIDKLTGQSTFFTPIESLGEGRYGQVRRFIDQNGGTYAVKSNKSDFFCKKIEGELQFMQKAYPASGRYHLFYFTSHTGNTQKSHYRYVMPDRKGMAFGKWAISEMSYYRLAHVVLLIATELYRLHENQIIHGDLTPGNILISSEGEEYSVYLVDFGLSYSTRGHILPLSLIANDTRFPPERKYSSTPASPKQDIYTLATTFKSILFCHSSFESIKLTFPAIHAFITQSIDDDPEHRPSLKAFCNTLKSEIDQAAQLARNAL